MPVTPEIAELKQAVAQKFAADISSGALVIKGGVYSCRKMRGKPGLPDAWSEHSWGNAWDLYYGDRPRGNVDKVVAWLKVEDSAGRLPVGSIITYGANGSHVHIEGSPKRNPRPHVSIPPCAEDGGGGHDPHDPEDEQMIRDMQLALNDAGIPDYEGNTLAVDGIWGPKTASANSTMVAMAAQRVPPGSGPGSGTYTVEGTVTLAPEGN